MQEVLADHCSRAEGEGKKRSSSSAVFEACLALLLTKGAVSSDQSFARHQNGMSSECTGLDAQCTAALYD